MGNHVSINGKRTTDGFKNITKGLGGTRDPQHATYYQRSYLHNERTASDFYTTDWLAGRVIDVPVDEATREWREMLIEDEDKRKEWSKFEGKINLASNFATAEKWARVYGGAVLLIVTDDDALEKPLDINSITTESKLRLIPLDRYRIVADVPIRDVLDENYGLPKFYTVTESGVRVHHSRVIRFEGVKTTITEAQRNNYWGASYYERLFDPIKNSQTSTQLISGMLYESNISTWKLKGLNELVGSKQDDLVIKRVKLATEMKSTINGAAIDSEDDLVNISKNFAGLAEIDDKAALKVAAAAGIPYTKLMGKSADGMNATGEGDMKNYYDMVRSDIQEGKFRDRLEYVDTIIAKIIDIEQPEFDFKPLYQLSEKEQADVENVRAQRDVAYFDRGIIGEEDILTDLAKNETYPTASKRLDELKELDEEIEE